MDLSSNIGRKIHMRTNFEKKSSYVMQRAKTVTNETKLKNTLTYRIENTIFLSMLIIRDFSRILEHRRYVEMCSLLTTSLV